MIPAGEIQGFPVGAAKGQIGRGGCPVHDAPELFAHDEAEAASLGCTGVPFFVFDRAFAVAGAHDPHSFLMALRQAWESSHPVTISESGEVCGDDGCPI